MGVVCTNEARILFSPSAESQRFLPEGPRVVTLRGRRAIAWVNIQTAADATRGELHFWYPDTAEHQVVPVPGRPGFLMPTDRPDTLLLGLTKEVGLYHVPSGGWEPLAAIPDDSPRTIVNDGEPLPGGRGVVFGTKDVNFAEPIGHLYLLTLDDRKLTVLAGGQTCSNGKVFADEGGELVLYDIDTPRRMVVRYRLDRQFRTLEDRGVAVDLRAVDGYPDGMVGCGDGTVVVAFYEPDPVPAGRAGRYRLGNGELVEQWTTPGSPRVTCPLLVEQDGVKLILTTAVEGMPAEMRAKCPHAGALFVA
ncbi:MAG TPA: SMP-30/gluconolactonase/LRE family protein, partial [Fimbriiglobus sp.]|nr:SMP-30/gluconolactonase/LRE family protein [Fimbriiglobus sp.]